MSLLLVQASDLWNKRHSVAIGDVHECKLIRRKEITVTQVDHIWKSMTATQYVRRARTHPKDPERSRESLSCSRPALLAQFAESAGAGLAGRRPEPRPRQRQTHRSQRVPRQQVGHRGPGKQSRCELAGPGCSARPG